VRDRPKECECVLLERESERGSVRVFERVFLGVMMALQYVILGRSQ